MQKKYDRVQLQRIDLDMDSHIIPNTESDHKESVNCPCYPMLVSSDAISGFRQWNHSWSNKNRGQPKGLAFESDSAET